MHEARDQIRKMNIVSVKDKEDKKEDSQDEKESSTDKVFALISLYSVNFLFSSTCLLPSTTYVIFVRPQYEANQKFGLCEALLSIGAWSVVKELCKKMPDHFLMEQSNIAKAMCNLLHVVIDPLYKK